MNITLEELLCFSTAAETLNFRKGAAQLRRSAASFGQRISSLEEKIGTPLFERSTRRVVLTEEGLRLAPLAENIVNNARTFEDLEAPGEEINVVLGTRHELGMSYVLPLISVVESAIEGLQLDLHFGSGDGLLSDLRNSEIDVAITSTRITDSSLEALEIHKERYVFVASTKLLQRVPLESFADAASHTLVDINRELSLFNYYQEANPRIHGQDFGRVRSLGTIDAIRKYVLEGRGVAVLPQYFVERDIDAKHLVPVLSRKEPKRDSFRLVFRRGDIYSTIYRRIAELLRQHPLQ